MLSLVHFLTPPWAVWAFTNILRAQEGWRNCLGVQGVPKSFPSVGWFLNEPGQEEWALTPGGGGVGETTGVTAEMKSCPQVMSRGAVVKAVEVYF